MHLVTAAAAAASLHCIDYKLAHNAQRILPTHISDSSNEPGCSSEGYFRSAAWSRAWLKTRMQTWQEAYNEWKSMQ